MKVTLTKRLGQNLEGSSVDYPLSQAQWLINRGHAVASISTEETAQSDTIEPPVYSTESLSKLSLRELRDVAASRGVPSYGTKADIAARLA